MTTFFNFLKGIEFILFIFILTMAHSIRNCSNLLFIILTDHYKRGHAQNVAALMFLDLRLWECVWEIVMVHWLKYFNLPVRVHMQMFSASQHWVRRRWLYSEICCHDKHWDNHGYTLQSFNITYWIQLLWIILPLQIIKQKHEMCHSLHNIFSNQCQTIWPHLMCYSIHPSIFCFPS